MVRTDGLAEEDPLAENVHREALHPLDQFRAFQALRDTGLGEDEIAARFFVSPAVVKQRLKLAAVSAKLLEIYANDGMKLEQLMAFTVISDPARQEQVWMPSPSPGTRTPIISGGNSPRARSAPRISARSLSAWPPMRPPAAG